LNHEIERKGSEGIMGGIAKPLTNITWG